MKASAGAMLRSRQTDNCHFAADCNADRCSVDRVPSLARRCTSLDVYYGDRCRARSCSGVVHCKLCTNMMKATKLRSGRLKS